jgi:hypothetical protein
MTAVWTPIPYTPDPAHPEHGLGRHIHRPEGFKNRLLSPQDPETIQSVTWERMCGVYNQGSVGSCTGNAGAGCMMTKPLFVPGRAFGEATALWIYAEATQFNGTPGQTYPPNDTGSSGPASAQGLEEMNLVSSYSHAVDLQGALTGLQSAPGSFGISWYTSFDTPLSTGECPLTPGATVRGGHEVEAFQVDTVNERVWFWNSWGAWGGLGNGTFWLSYATLNSLFAESADATFFVGTSQVNPSGVDPLGVDPDVPVSPVVHPTPTPAPVVAPTGCSVGAAGRKVKRWLKG